MVEIKIGSQSISYCSSTHPAEKNLSQSLPPPMRRSNENKDNNSKKDVLRHHLWTVSSIQQGLACGQHVGFATTEVGPEDVAIVPGFLGIEK